MTLTLADEWARYRLEVRLLLDRAVCSSLQLFVLSSVTVPAVVPKDNVGVSEVLLERMKQLISRGLGSGWNISFNSDYQIMQTVLCEKSIVLKPANNDPGRNF